MCVCVCVCVCVCRFGGRSSSGSSTDSGADAGHNYRHNYSGLPHEAASLPSLPATPGCHEPARRRTCLTTIYQQLHTLLNNHLVIKIYKHTCKKENVLLFDSHCVCVK